MPRADRPAIVWFTRDLRLVDHPALHAAAESGRALVAVYVLDDAAGGDWAMGAASRWWLHHSLASLAASLDAAGIRLILRRGNAAQQIAALVRETKAAELHVGQPVEPAARAELDALEPSLGCTLHRHWTTLLADPDSLRTSSGRTYWVYTPFANAIFTRGIGEHALPAPQQLRAAPTPKSDTLADWNLIPTRPDWAGGLRDAWEPGEDAAHRRLHRFIEHDLAEYDTTRNLPGQDGTSRLSPHLHWGEISPRVVWQAASPRTGAGTHSFLREILWREFSAHLLWHHPQLPDTPLKPALDSVSWRRAPDELKAWQQGRTGFPIVDAGMRQLWATGWQHNRVRLITASFLIKHLLIDWRAGEAWFWDCLVDADLGSNSQNWQWVAGCGADASPFFRIFNPVLQSRRFDANGDYIRQWVPELAALNPPHIHAPWEAPPETLAAANISLGKTYPHPLVDLTTARHRALAAFKAA